MDKNIIFGGALIGLLFGALVGASIFALAGNLDLRLGFISIAVFAAVGGVFGSLLAPKLMVWLEERKERHPNHRPLTEITERVYSRDKQEPYLPITTEVFSVDILRPLSLFVLLGLIGILFVYLNLDVGTGFLPFAAFFFVLALYHLTRLLLNLGHNVQLSQNGFQYSLGQERHFTSWVEIDKVWEKKQKYSWNFIPVWNIHSLKITTRNGTTILLSRILSRFEDLADIIQGAVTKHLLPTAIEDVEHGGILDFDEFKITNQGIQHKKDLLLWHEVEKIIIYQARIQVRRTGKNWFNWAEAKAWNIANFPLFVIIINRYTKVE